MWPSTLVFNGLPVPLYRSSRQMRNLLRQTAHLLLVECEEMINVYFFCVCVFMLAIPLYCVWPGHLHWLCPSLHSLAEAEGLPCTTLFVLFRRVFVHKNPSYLVCDIWGTFKALAICCFFCM